MPFSTLPVPSPSDSSTVYSVQEFPNLELFREQMIYPAINIPVQETATLRKKLRHLLLGPRLKNVFADASNPQRRILVLQSETKQPHITPLTEGQDCIFCEHCIEYTYDDFTVDQVLGKLLPFEEVPSSFEIAGHIAHVNLREEYLPFKYWIGKVLLDKNQPRIKTVVTKIGTIATEFRTFGMEVIAGDDSDGWSIVTVREEGSVFQLDFRHVYWNSRLAGEHKRLVDLILKQQHDNNPVIVADLMAGVGPFAVPLTSQHTHCITVYANDLNPASFKYLEINAKTNQCRNLYCFNRDGRDFVRYLQQEKIEIDHFIMNLPASAPEFLDAFRGYRVSSPTRLPRIHVHCFCPKSDELNDYQSAVDRCANALGCVLDRERDSIHIHVVRDVSPNKNMLCVSFRLPDAVKCLPATVDSDEPDRKRSKI